MTPTSPTTSRSQLRCGNCRETTVKATYVTVSESVEMPKGRGTANLVQKCKLSGRDGTIPMIPGQGTPLTIEQSQKGEKACLMVFDCRGYKPVEFSFADGLMAESLEGTPFNIDCSEGEFADYDEKGEYSVGLGKLESTFKVYMAIQHYEYVVEHGGGNDRRRKGWWTTSR